MYDLFVVVLVIASVSSFFLAAFAFYNDLEYKENGNKECKKEYDPLMGTLKKTLVAVVVSLLGVIFIPTKNELYAIYGIGGTIDYIRNNDTAKQLPDKVINALDKWIDDKTKEDKK